MVRAENGSAGVSARDGLGEEIGGRQCRKGRQQFMKQGFEADSRPRVIFCSSVTHTPIDHFL